MTLFTGNNLIDLRETDSTNNYALNLLKEKQPFEGTVIRTFRQTVGRGQRYKHWESADFSNLTFSIIYYPVFLSVNRQFQLSKVVALGVADFVKKIINYGGIKIKWPNDIYIEEKKVAGILIENAVNSNKIISSVIGIGLNVNQIVFSADIPNPISLKIAAEKDFDLESCFRELCSTVEARYLQLKSGKDELINNDYHNLLFGLAEKRKFILNGNSETAQIDGVNEEGKLKLKTASSIVECGLNEVQYIF